MFKEILNIFNFETKIGSGSSHDYNTRRTDLGDALFSRSHSFGSEWGMHGSLDKTEVSASIGAIVSSDNELRIGLSAQQMDNLGCGYGNCSVTYGGEQVAVEIYNLFGKDSLAGDRIAASQGLVDTLGISIGKGIIITRIATEEGKLKFECEYDKSNPFGQKWNHRLKTANARVVAIDEDGYNSELFRIGLSAMQMDNLGIDRQSKPLTSRGLIEVIRRLDRGLLDRQNFSDLTVKFAGRTISAKVYNAAGLRSCGGCGVRISSTLAEELGISIGDTINIKGQ